MYEDRSATITIGGESYELVLTTKATREIGKRYGGLEQLGNKLMRNENFEEALDEVIWIITLLANQSIMIHNFRHKDNPRELLTVEYMELMTHPYELADYQNAITEAMTRGTKRNVESEDAKTKNQEAV